MVGQGVLRECALDARVASVLVIGRTPSGREDPKVTEVILRDVTDLGPLESRITGLDACFFCLGVSSAGMSEPEYRRLTRDLTLKVAAVLARLNPAMTFIYVSGTGTDSTGRGRVMWARVKGETENALLGLPFRAAYMFRPGFIQPLHGITSKTGLYRVLYAVASPLVPVAKRIWPRWITSTEQVGRAMIQAAGGGSPKVFLENEDINALARRGAPAPGCGP